MGSGRAVGSGSERQSTRLPHGPRNDLAFGWDVLAVALLSLAVYAPAIRSRLPAEQALEYVGDLTAEAEAEEVEEGANSADR